MFVSPCFNLAATEAGKILDNNFSLLFFSMDRSSRCLCSNVTSVQNAVITSELPSLPKIVETRTGN